MKAIIENDIIINITAQGDTEIGSLPKGIGRERLRFDGRKVIDLATLNKIWVKPIGQDFFEFHCMEVQGSQEVVMTYADRKNLIMEEGVIRVKTEAEILAGALDQEKTMIKNRLRAILEKEIGDTKDNIADLYKIITLLIDYIISNDQGIKDFLNGLILDLRAAYPMESQAQNDLWDRVNILKEKMTEYYAEKNAIELIDK